MTLHLRTLVVVLAALVACRAGAQPGGPPPPFKDSTTIPDTPAYARARQVLALVNECNEERVKSYIASSFAPSFRDRFDTADHLGAFTRAHDGSQKLEQYGARSYEPPRPGNHAVLICRNTLAESWQAVVVEVDEAPPHLITSLGFLPARPPVGQGGGKALEPDEIARQLGAYVDRLAAADAFSGTVLLAKDGKVILTRAVGIANRDFDAPVTIDTKFNLGSMNKMMTGVAVMQLVEQGKLSLDDPISKHLSEDWLPKVPKDQVKVIHLLTHTSGLGSYFTDEWQRSARDLYRRVDDYKPIVKDETLAFSPGTDWKYSNTGMLIAGAIVQKVSGQDYYDYIREHITGPAGMTNTDFYSLDAVNKNLAVGYEKSRGGGTTVYTNNIYAHVIRGGPAGGGYSTVTDLLRFDQALRAGKLLKKESLDTLWSPHPEVSSPEYGLGFGIFQTPLGRAVGHSGGFTGISANLNMFLDAGYTIAILSNYGEAAAIVDAKVRELLLQGR